MPVAHICSDQDKKTDHEEKRSEEPRRPKDIPAQLRFDHPVETVDEAWLMETAVKFKRSYEEFVLYYLSTDFYFYLIADWRDAADILKGLISELRPFVSAREICETIDSIVRRYEELTTCPGAPIPDAIRLAAFVNEVVECALAVEPYRKRIEIQRGTAILEVLRCTVMDRILPKTTVMVLQRASMLGTGSAGAMAA